MRRSIEGWLPVVGYEGLYEVSDLGGVRGCDRRAWNGHGYHLLPGQVLKTRLDSHGRPQVSLYKSGERWTPRTYRLVLEAFVGPCPEGEEACHNNGDPLDNRLENLRWDTHEANMLDAVRQRTHNNARKTHCKRGHEFTAENTRINKSDGGRHCRACKRERERHARVMRRAS